MMRKTIAATAASDFTIIARADAIGIEGIDGAAGPDAKCGRGSAS